MFGQRLKEIRNREDKKVTQQRLADLLGVDRSSVAKWETSDIVPSLDIIKQIASIFEVSMDYLTGFDRNVEVIDINPTIKLPLYECIPADIPLEEITDAVDFIDIPASSLEEEKKYFCFKMNDCSMSPKYLEGDILIIEKNDEFHNGQDCLLSIYNSDAFIRRVIIEDDGYLLQSLNKVYASTFIDNESVKILGLIKGLVRIF